MHPTVPRSVSAVALIPGSLVRYNRPGMTVSLVARRHGVAPNQLFTWCRLAAQGALTAAVAAKRSCRRLSRLQNQVRELHRLLGKKTLEAEILKEALEHATGSKNV